MILIAAPQDSKLGNLTLVVALLCALPFVFSGVVAGFAKIQPVLNRPSPRITVTQLRTPPTRIRSLAIVATGAVAVFGVVAIQGAQQNLQRGLDASAHGIDSSADVWVTPRGESNAFATTPFTYPEGTRALARLPGVRDVSVYRGSFLTWGDRRLWVLAPPSSSTQPIPPSEIVARQPRSRECEATRRRMGGRLAGARGRTRPARRPEVHAARARAHELPRRCTEHKPGMATGLDHRQLPGLRTRLAQQRPERV